MHRVVPDLDLSLPSDARAGRRACLVTAAIAGPSPDGDVATANRAQALVLRELGYEVDILYTRVAHGEPLCVQGQFVDQVDEFQDLGLRLLCIGNQGADCDYPALSYLAMQHLLRERYDVVLFDDLFGTGYYPLLARRTGNQRLRDTAMCVTLQCSLQWLAESNQTSIATFEDLRRAEMERRSVELADSVRAPSRYILSKHRSYGWDIPDRSVVIPNFVRVESSLLQERSTPTPVKELVFFSALETRKGLWMFCRALSRLKYDVENLQVTFLGETAIEGGAATAEALLRYAAKWPFSVRLLTGFNRHQAIAYLRRPGRLAVVPSLESNSPRVVLECLAHGIPFIASSGSGIEELVDGEFHAANLFEPTVASLCDKIRGVLKFGAFAARATFEPQVVRDAFAGWLDSLPPRNGGVSEFSGAVEPVFVITVPASFDAQKAISALKRTAFMNEGVNVEVLAQDPASLERLLAVDPASSRIKVNVLEDFDAVARRLGALDTRLVVFCHITQIPSDAFVSRAWKAFSLDPTLAALTGMVARSTKKSAAEPRPYVSRSKSDHLVERFLLGDAAALFPLSQETNAGYFAVRSNRLARFCGVDPLDHRYDTPKRMQDWVHELLIQLYLSGERFELVPDEVIEQPVRDYPFEASRLESTMRSLTDKLYGASAGRSQSLVSRLGVDSALQNARHQTDAEYFRIISERVGMPIHQLPPLLPAAEHARMLATLAHRCGQIDLAIDICAKLAADGSPLGLGAYVNAAASGQVVSVVEALRSGYRPFNVGETEDLIGAGDRRRIRMWAHPLGDGVASIVLPTLNLEKTTQFTSLIENADPDAGPVLFRLELISRDEDHRWTGEKVVRGGEEVLWKEECPEELRQECTVKLSVESADWEYRKSALVCWIDPLFSDSKGPRA